MLTLSVVGTPAAKHHPCRIFGLRPSRDHEPLKHKSSSLSEFKSCNFHRVSLFFRWSIWTGNNSTLFNLLHDNSNTAGFVYKCSRRLKKCVNCPDNSNIRLGKRTRNDEPQLSPGSTCIHICILFLFRSEPPKNKELSDIRSSYSRSSLKFWIWIQLSTIEFRTFKEPLFLVRVVDLSDCLYWRDTKHGENTPGLCRVGFLFGWTFSALGL